MARYTFTCEHFDYDMFRGEENGVASKHITEFRADDLTTMLENFELFLRGAGFHFVGTLDIVSADGEDSFDEDDADDSEKSKNVMGHIVDDILKNPITMKEQNTIFINSDNMNHPFDVWNKGAAMSTLAIDDTINLTGLSDMSVTSSIKDECNFDMLVGRCEVCGIDKQIMTVHRCYDDNCPLYATKD
jgi:hypothetical protein